VYWQVVLLGIAAAVAVVILGVAVLMPPAPPTPPQLYVKVVPSGGSYLLYVNDSKALREVWYSKNGGPLLKADGPIKAACGDRVEVVAVYEDGSRHSVAAVVKCTAPLRSAASKTVYSVYTLEQAAARVAREASPDAISIMVRVWECDDDGDPYVAIGATAVRGTIKSLPYTAQVWIRYRYPKIVNGIFIWEERFNVSGILPLTLKPDGESQTIVKLTVLHPPGLAAVSDYMAGSPNVLNITRKGSKVYVNGTYAGECVPVLQRVVEVVQETLEGQVVAQFQYTYDAGDGPYTAWMKVYQRPDGGFALEAYHQQGGRVPDNAEQIGNVKTTLISAVASGASEGEQGVVADMILKILNGYEPSPEELQKLGPQSQLVVQFVQWFKSLSLEQQEKLKEVVWASKNLVQEPAMLGDKDVVITKTREYVRLIGYRPVGSTVQVSARSISVPGLFVALYQGYRPFIIPDYVFTEEQGGGGSGGATGGSAVVGFYHSTEAVIGVYNSTKALAIFG